MRRSFNRVWVIAGFLALCAPAARGQETASSGNSVAPYPPASSAGSRRQANTFSPDRAQRDAAPAATSKNPLTSIEQWTPGTQSGAVSLLLAGIDVREGVDSNASFSGTATSWTSLTQFHGSVALQRMRRRSQLTLNYSGNGSLYAKGSAFDTTYHTLGVMQRIDWRRWALLLSDSVGYSSNSTFGLGLYGAAANVGTGVGLGGGVLNPILNPSQSIFTGRAGRLSNTVAAQLQYAPTARSAFTASGSFGILHFLDGGLVDGNDTTFQAGYNYAITSRNMFAVNYSGSLARFSGTDQGIHSHSVQLGYGRRVTGRLSFQALAGPQLSTFRNTLVSNGRRLSWDMQTSLGYQFARSGLTVAYFHGVTGGSGIFLGAQSDEVQLGINHQLSRFWEVSWQAAYGRNSALLSTVLASGNQLYNFWTGGVQLGRKLGSTTRVYIDYRIERQTAQGIACGSSICGNLFLRQEISLGLNFNTRPVRLK